MLFRHGYGGYYLSLISGLDNYLKSFLFMNHIPVRVGHRCRVALLSFALFSLLEPAWSQQWSGPDASGNIYNTNTGNVGIGTGSAPAKLTVAGAVYAISPDAESHFSYGTYVDPSPGIGYAIKVGSGGIAVTGNAIVPSGRVGIGTTTPGAPLHVVGMNYTNGSIVVDQPVVGGISGWFRGASAGNSNLVIQGGGGNYEAYWITATNGLLKIGANGGVEPAVGAININDNGNVGIETTNTYGYMLAVNGSAIFTQAVVKAYANWPDYVFRPGYRLPSLDSLSHYIRANHHLPEMPSADSVEKNGLDLGGNQAALLKKVEELTLYIVQQQKELSAQRRRISRLEAKMQTR